MYIALWFCFWHNRVMKDNKITTRAEDYSQWYLDVIEAADLADYGPVKGTMVIKPTGYAIWENIQKNLDKMFKKVGVQNAYFPLFFPESFLKREAEHVEGFAPEVAMVTHAGGKKLEEPLVLRPTSETVIYNSYSKWIQSYRDLPLLINQWANVVRWEMRTRLFLRTSEFLWQEGHTAHATREDAENFQKKISDIYKSFAEDYLAVPVIAGRKSESEKFAGAQKTYTMEAMMQDGKALQYGTTHLLDQKFSESFDMKFLDQDGSEKYVWSTSWGVSTRLIGGIIMAHSDDKGLVLPPKIAPLQVVIVPLWNNDEEKTAVLAEANRIFDELCGADISVKLDDRDLRPGPRFFEWEKKGVPIRIEIGPRDLGNSSVVVVRRDTGEKENVPMVELSGIIEKKLETMQKEIFERALKSREEKTYSVDSWEEFEKIFQGDGGFVKAHWCGDAKCEAEIAEKTKATIRCIPFDQEKEKGKCILCGGESSERVVFAKSY